MHTDFTTAKIKARSSRWSMGSRRRPCRRSSDHRLAIDHVRAASDLVALPGAGSLSVNDESEQRSESDVVRELGNERERRDRRKASSNHSDIDHTDHESGTGAPDH